MPNPHPNPTLFQKDGVFDKVYPPYIRELSQRHWTPVDIAQKAGTFLGLPGAQVLDMGSGVGKFCLTAGFFCPDTIFVGVEQRGDLHQIAIDALEQMSLTNVHFIHGNIIALDFSKYDHFYFYNSFYEHIDPEGGIDSHVTTSVAQYNAYADFMYKMLATRPPDTRLVTYHGTDDQVPAGYHMVNNSYNSLLKMWIKE